MSPSWQFKALVEPTLKQWRVVYDRGRRQVQFFTEREAAAFASANGGTVEPITPLPFTLQKDRKITHEDKIIAAIDRNTKAIEDSTYALIQAISVSHGAIFTVLFFIMLTIGCPRAKAAPLVSDGDEIASVGTEVRQ